VDNEEIKYQAAGLFFTWNDVKNRENINKHEGVTFKAAAEIFCDPHVVYLEPYIRNHEIRWNVIGKANPNWEVILFVVVTERVTIRGVGALRIISARYATAYEEELDYVEQRID
jgi:uncharacterized DUF497 family protein